MTNKAHVMKALRRLILVPLCVVGILSILATGGGGGGSSGTSNGTSSFVLYDDFSPAMIDRSKWEDLEFVRRINNGVLESELARFGSDGSNGLNLVNPDTVNAIQADVTVTAVSNTNAEARARVIGDFYNDGTVGGGFVGDVLAGAEIRHNGTGLVVVFFVARCDDRDCVTYTLLMFDDTTFGPVTLGKTHTLSVAWDGVSQFTFGIDLQAPVTFDPTAMAPVAGPAGSSRFKGIGTRVSGISGPDEGAFIAATFDNVVVNGSPYDDFSTAMIDRTKWLNLEFVRRVNNGVLESAITRFGSTGGNGSNNLDFVDPDTVSGIQADVTVTAESNNAAETRARVAGDFYNIGTPGGGYAGDVLASTRIHHNGTQLVGNFRVFLCTDFDCNRGTSVFFSDAPGPVAVGETHTLSVAWDGKLFTFGFDGLTTTFDPAGVAPPVAKPRQAWKIIGTRLNGIGGPDEGGSIAARFDNVRVTRGSTNLPLPPEALTWTLTNVTFADGGVATGTFQYDPVGNLIFNWNISVSGGDETTFPPFTYDPTTTEAGVATGLPDIALELAFEIDPVGFTLEDHRFLALSTDVPLTNAGGTIPLNTTALFNSRECYNCNPFREVATGSLVANVP